MDAPGLQGALSRASLKDHPRRSQLNATSLSCPHSPQRIRFGS